MVDYIDRIGEWPSLLFIHRSRARFIRPIGLYNCMRAAKIERTGGGGLIVTLIKRDEPLLTFDAKQRKSSLEVNN